MTEKLENKSAMKILVVDDDPYEVKALTLGLSMEGFDVDGAEDGETALKMLDETVYNAALIDLMMPGINGLQLARKIREKHPDVSTLLMSAYHLSPMQLAKADTGIVGFIPKPFRFHKLVQYLNGKLGAKAAPAAAASGQ